MAVRPYYGFVGKHLKDAEVRILNDIQAREGQLRQALIEEIEEDLKEKLKLTFEKIGELTHPTKSNAKRLLNILKLADEIEKEITREPPDKFIRVNLNRLAEERSISVKEVEFVSLLVQCSRLYSELTKSKVKIIELL